MDQQNKIRLPLNSLTPEDEDFLKRLEQFFFKLGKPKPGEWLYHHKEKGQTFEQYRERNTALNLQRTPNVIYLVPLEQSIQLSFLSRIERMISSFYYTMQVKMLAPVNIQAIKIQKRQDSPTSHPQYNAKQLIDYLKTIKKQDAYCTVGFLSTDIYPSEEWNYVFGLADSDIGCGVFSFARYHQSFYKGQKFPDYTIDDLSYIIFRSSMVLIHEIGHLFDLRHCISYSCLMNGSNSLEETEKRDALFCPNCLKKLMFKIRGNPQEHLKSFTQGLNDIGEGRFILLAEQIKKQLDLIKINPK